MAIKLLLWRTTFAGDDGKSDDIYRLIVYEKTFSFSFVLSPSLGDCVFVGIEKKISFFKMWYDEIPQTKGNSPPNALNN